MVTLVAVSWKPCDACNAAPFTVVVAIDLVGTAAGRAGRRQADAGDARPFVSADVGVKAPRPSTVANLTTWPTTPAPVASRTVAVTVAGVAVVTVVVDSASEIDGAPAATAAVADTEKPTEPVTSVPLTVAWATARSAPLAVVDAGFSVVVAVPFASVSADVGRRSCRGRCWRC